MLPELKFPMGNFVNFCFSISFSSWVKKRELINACISGKPEKALDGYNVQFVDIVLSHLSYWQLICYLYVYFSPEVQEDLGLVFFIPFCLLFCFS